MHWSHRAAAIPATSTVVVLNGVLPRGRAACAFRTRALHLPGALSTTSGTARGVRIGDDTIERLRASAMIFVSLTYRTFGIGSGATTIEARSHRIRCRFKTATSVAVADIHSNHATGYKRAADHAADGPQERYLGGAQSAMRCLRQPQRQLH